MPSDQTIALQTERRILLIRKQKVMLDSDLAELYGVEARALNQAVKRNAERFPEDFMFRLTAEEAEALNSASATSKTDSDPDNTDDSSQTVMSSRKHRGKVYLPYAFTEQGVAMLSSVLRSRRAVQVNIAIMRAFVTPEAFDQYFLTGHFTEESKRSKLIYLFRKGKPTIAFREEDGGLRPLCTLCLHPIGYYAETWAGVTCPTDEVIAHLLMMRGAEEKFWAQANQHPINHPASGV